MFLDLPLTDRPALESPLKLSCMLTTCTTRALNKHSIHRLGSESLPVTFVLHLIVLTSFAAATSSIFVLTPMIRLSGFYYFPSDDLQASLL